MSGWVVLGAMAGAGVGAVARFWLSTLRRGPFPWPTIVANVVGTTLLGAALAAADSDALGPAGLTILGAGVAGGLTTFSSLALDAVGLWRESPSAAVTYLAATWSLGLAGGVVGWHLSRAVLGQ